MNKQSILSKCKTRTTSEQHDNKTILETTGREKTTSTMVNDRQQLQTMGMRNQQQLKLRQYRKLWVVRWRWSHFRAPDPSRDILSEVSHTTTTKNRLYYDKVCKSTQKWADDDRQYRQTKKDNQQSIKKRIQFAARGTRLCKFHRRSCSTGGAIDAQSFECSCP